jgi:hypothetical protein
MSRQRHREAQGIIGLYLVTNTRVLDLLPEHTAFLLPDTVHILREPPQQQHTLLCLRYGRPEEDVAEYVGKLKAGFPLLLLQEEQIFGPHETSKLRTLKRHFKDATIWHIEEYLRGFSFNIDLSLAHLIKQVHPARAARSEHSVSAHYVAGHPGAVGAQPLDQRAQATGVGAHSEVC